MSRSTLPSSACSSTGRIAAPPAAAATSAALRMQQRFAPTTAAASAARSPAPRPPLRRRRSPLLVVNANSTTTTTADLPPAPIAAPSCRLVKEVAVDVQRTSISSRVLVAAVDIAAPPSAVWAALTDYERLADFIPSLEANECLAHDPQQGTARLRQVGAQDVAMGVKFRAAVTLDIREHRGPGGIPAAMITSSQDSRDYLGAAAKFPAPVASPEDDEDEAGALVEAARAMGEEGGGSVASLATASRDEDLPPLDGGGGVVVPSSWPRDISFELVEGDFSAFRGVWRVDQGPAGPLSARLSYAVFVQPQAFLPVGLIQGRISRDVATNLKSVRAHAEEVVFERLLRQQQQKQAVAA